MAFVICKKESEDKAMKQQEFYEQIKQVVEELVGQDYHVSLSQIEKVGFGQLNVLFIRKEEQLMMPIIYLQDYYIRFQRGEEIQTLARDIVTKYAQKSKYQEKIVEDFDFLNQKEQIKQRIFFRCVSTEQVPSSIPYREVLDFSIVYGILVSYNKNSTTFITITEDIKNRYSWTEEELFQLSMENTCRLFPEQMQSMVEILSREFPDMANTLENDTIGCTVISNRFNFYGFSVIFYPRVLVRLAEEKGGNLVIIPSSVHEALVLVDNGMVDTVEINQTIRFVNHTQVLEEEQLSNQAYYYDRETKKLYFMEDVKKGGTSTCVKF